MIMQSTDEETAQKKNDSGHEHAVKILRVIYCGPSLAYNALERSEHCAVPCVREIKV